MAMITEEAVGRTEQSQEIQMSLSQAKIDRENGMAFFGQNDNGSAISGSDRFRSPYTMNLRNNIFKS
jgi:hypothetical protein